MSIELENLSSTYLSLDGMPKLVTITGTHRGPRLVIKGASGHTIRFSGVRFFSDNDEDAICFEGEVADTNILGQDARLDGAITFWGKLENVTVSGFNNGDYLEIGGQVNAVNTTFDTSTLQLVVSKVVGQ